MSNFSSICPTGNTIIFDEPRRKLVECDACDGHGHVAYETIDQFIDELSHLQYKRRKQGNPIMTYRELLRVARIIRKEGMECPVCDGIGMVEK